MVFFLFFSDSFFFGSLLSYLEPFISTEVRKTTSEGLLFRGQNLTIKALSIFSHQVGRTYLIEILQPFFLEMESELLVREVKKGGGEKKETDILL